MNTGTTQTYTLSLHDALPISARPSNRTRETLAGPRALLRTHFVHRIAAEPEVPPKLDRKSTRLNSSHLGISYAVFCLKKKTNGSVKYDVTSQPVTTIRINVAS